MRQTPLMRSIETRLGSDISAYIIQLLNTHKTQREIADDIGVSRATVNKWIQELGVHKLYGKGGE